MQGVFFYFSIRVWDLKKNRILVSLGSKKVSSSTVLTLFPSFNQILKQYLVDLQKRTQIPGGFPVSLVGMDHEITWPCAAKNQYRKF